MQIFLINLTRRPDRLAAMTAKLGRLGLGFTRVDALDATTAPVATLARHFEANGPLGAIPKGDKCCTVSHRRAWQAFLVTGASYGVILEDDVALGSGLLLKDSTWIPAGCDLVKLEQYGPPSQRILVSDPVAAPGGHVLARLVSRHTGAAAYVVSRAAAEYLLKIEKWSLPVDHMLFNPNNSPVFARLVPRQLMPAIARQEAGGARSDIEGWRTQLRAFDATYARRELVRFGYELKLLPRQLLSVALGKAKLVRIGTKT